MLRKQFVGDKMRRHLLVGKRALNVAFPLALHCYILGENIDYSESFRREDQSWLQQLPEPASHVGFRQLFSETKTIDTLNLHVKDRSSFKSFKSTKIAKIQSSVECGFRSSSDREGKFSLKKLTFELNGFVLDIIRNHVMLADSEREELTSSYRAKIMHRLATSMYLGGNIYRIF